MKKLYSISLLPGDGIGHEISLEAKKILNWVDTNTDLNLECVEDLVGGISIDTYGTPLCDKTLERIKRSDAIILGAVGGLKWEKLPFESRPERGLLKIRKELDLFANFRPAIVFDSLISSSSLKPEIIKDLDILIIRELTGGIYFGEPRGVEKINKNLSKGYNTLVYTTPEIERIARVAFEASQQRSKKLCSVDKANVLESTELWREVVTSVAKDFPDVELSHMYVDNASMQLVRNPKQFDVIVTTNMFGDILSDCASMLTGSLGMLPSASLGYNSSGEKKAMYEPVHGSAPDIAGQGIANPLAMILSVGMMFKYSFSRNDISVLITKVINSILEKGYRTKDIIEENCKEISTSEMGDLVLEGLKNEKI
ncbi:MAG: 3-isopropylmalate dehydrogenase [Rickettsiales bacterium]|nr:3-isopropylmalate dehydrogenase [Rickettsiales bacterium]|tara:strand:- start:646 stop:1752 length:1107 start_codon:yes stop_codon:yes gene_type:complete